MMTREPSQAKVITSEDIQDHSRCEALRARAIISRGRLICGRG